MLNRTGILKSEAREEPMENHPADYAVCSRQCGRAFLECEASKTDGDPCEDDYRSCVADCTSP
jgi:hypothetical protein